MLEDIRPFVPHTLEELVASGVFKEGQLNLQHYARIVSAYEHVRDCRVMRITYRSNGLLVTGILVMPSVMQKGGHPLILFNRGGNREFGRLTVFAAMRTLIPLCRTNNALVFASNYRGVDGGEGAEEFGGADVEDILSLLAIARGYPEWDGKHSLMVGHSRGSMMTGLALKHGADVNAAVLSAGVSDLRSSGEERPELVEKVFREIIPDFEAKRQERYVERSSLCWPEFLRAPLLLLHGDADVRVHVSQSVRLAEVLTKLHYPHELVIYPGDDHFLTRNHADALARMGEWMRRHSKPAF